MDEEKMVQEEVFREEFYHRTGRRWQEIMLGSNQPFAWHRYFNVMITVANLKPEQGQIQSILSRRGVIYNIIAG
nr:hypothetical protein [Desulforamulus aquiferis]